MWHLVTFWHDLAGIPPVWTLFFSMGRMDIIFSPWGKPDIPLFLHRWNVRMWHCHFLTFHRWKNSVETWGISGIPPVSRCQCRKVTRAAQPGIPPVLNRFQYCFSTGFKPVYVMLSRLEAWLSIPSAPDPIPSKMWPGTYSSLFGWLGFHRIWQTGSRDPHNRNHVIKKRS